MIELSSALRFTRLLNDFRQIKRTILVNGETRLENDNEHSYQLAMLAWYLLQADNLGLNVDLVIKYALVHDLVEVYAGDTYIYSEATDITTKHEREEAARLKLAQDYPDFPELGSLIDGYETKGNRETKFVYALDKILPVLNIYLDDGRTWKENSVTLDMIIDNKVAKVKQFPELVPLFDELVSILQQEESRVFEGGE